MYQTINWLFYKNYIESRCCQQLKSMHLQTAKTEKLNSAIFKQMMLHLNMINNSNTRLCKSIENIDHKLQTIMKADCRVRALVLPLPTIPAPFINMLPTNEYNATNRNGRKNSIRSKWVEWWFEV